MIQELPPGPKSETEIRELANSYARKVINSVDWLENMPPIESSDVILMIFAHADQDLFDRAFSNIRVYEDEIENQSSHPASTT